MPLLPHGYAVLDRLWRHLYERGRPTCRRPVTPMQPCRTGSRGTRLALKVRAGCLNRRPAVPAMLGYSWRPSRPLRRS
ncbi:MAG TPA: hypothetical protein VGC19_04445 [Rhodanobacter sp.]